jgi:hypothetical protein
MALDSAVWPSLPLAEWQDTHDTLHMWLPIVGKSRLALAPRENHWWHVPLYGGARGLTTGRSHTGLAPSRSSSISSTTGSA